MRVPCAALALDVTESESGTIQAEVVSTMAICGSIITNLIATTSAVLAVSYTHLHFVFLEGMKKCLLIKIFSGICCISIFQSADCSGKFYFFALIVLMRQIQYVEELSLIHI